MVDSEHGLAPCLNSLNCVFVQQEFEDVERVFSQLKQIAKKLPRTRVIEESNNFWKGVSRTLIFSDDLEIFRIGKRIQIKSASRIGASDLGVNGRRVRRLLSELDKLK